MSRSKTVPAPTRRLLDWYDAHARDLPWRVAPGAVGAWQEPYRVWLSEIMLQQTTVPHAAPYYLRFLELWPRVEDLARAPLDDVLREWAGLGYYARARNLHKCAVEVAGRGGFPDTVEGLVELPGVGPYTASAVAAIAFGRPTAPVDGNVERVMSRLYAISGDGTPKGWAADKREIKTRAEALVPPDRPGDFAQAMMDLGATICTPKSPACGSCPWSEPCAARREGLPEAYPAKPKKKAKPIRCGAAFVLEDAGEVLLRRRPPQGLLGGMLMPPGGDWLEAPRALDVSDAPAPADWTRMGDIRHVFTHFALELDVWRADLTGPRPDGVWIPRADVLDAGLPSVGRKAVALALGGAS